jgi:ubiquinone/menaquinone biosynthesis C-methylase UbiE
MSAENNQPDWDKMAEKFDLWLPQLEPVGESLLEKLNAAPGDNILDLASGTGEPALTLAKRMAGKIEIIGTDAADGMVQVAQGKAVKEALSGISFQCMPAENLTFEDNSFDKALCRFGVMLFENPLQGLKEMRRVLKPGGLFALAVWSTPETMPTMYWSYEVFKNRIPEEMHPPIAKVTSLGAPGIIEGLLTDASFSEFTVEKKSFHYQFPSFDAFWDIVEASDVLKMQYDALPETERKNIRDEVGAFARDFITEDGLKIPHEYLLVYGFK